MAERYQESGRAGEFVLDILKLHVKTLLANESGEEKELKEGEHVQDEFKKYLHSFIQRNALKHMLLKDMGIIMVSAKCVLCTILCAS